MATRKRKINGITYTLYESGRSHLVNRTGRSQKRRATQLRKSFSGLSFRVIKGVGGKYDIYKRKK